MFVDHARARVSNATSTTISQAGLVWALISFLRTVGHPSIFIMSAMHLITKKDMFVDRVRVRARWLLLARNAESAVATVHRQCTISHALARSDCHCATPSL